MNELIERARAFVLKWDGQLDIPGRSPWTPDAEDPLSIIEALCDALESEASA